MELKMMAEMYNISKFYIPQDDHYDLAKDVIRCLIDLSYNDDEISRYFNEFDEVMKALDEYNSYVLETEEVSEMDDMEYIEMEKQDYLDEKFGGDYYEYLDEQ